MRTATNLAMFLCVCIALIGWRCAVNEHALQLDPVRLNRLAEQIDGKIDAAEVYFKTDPHPEIEKYLKPARAAVEALRNGGDLQHAREVIASFEPAFRTYLALQGRTPAQIELEVAAISTALDVLEWCVPVSYPDPMVTP